MYKPSWWTYCFSFLKEIIIETQSSQQHEDLQVSIYKGQLRLNTRNTIYSWGVKYKNFSDAFLEIDIQNNPPKTILVLGLGLGSIPLIIENSFGIVAEYDIVEYDEMIIEMAEYYHLSSLKSQLSYFHTDAYVYMCNITTQYDLVCMDIFEDNIIPSQFLSTEYLNLLKTTISPNGYLVFNCLAETESDRAIAQDFFDNTFKLIFPTAIIYPIHYNYMLVYRNIK